MYWLDTEYTAIKHSYYVESMSIADSMSFQEDPISDVSRT